MSRWTNTEEKLLRKLYAHPVASKVVVANALPRHPYSSIRTRAWALKLTAGCRRGAQRRALHWLRLAHTYFADRERGVS